MDEHEYSLARVKRRWVPEILWHWAVHPIPFWNDVFPQWRFSLTFITKLFSTDDEDEIEAVFRAYRGE